jgi:nicotinamide riboside kinase
MRPLPIGFQSFPDLRKGGYLYVDKTEDIHRMISTGKTYFLSRPRRFGKSLLVSTLEAIFKGRKDLFEGLYIYDKIDWDQHPLIKIDWSKIQRDCPEKIEKSMSSYLNRLAAKHQISLTSGYACDRFDELITGMHDKFDKQVAILIDEYDMPILDALNKPDILKNIQNFLQNFYKVVKANDEHLRFVFLTGVSKYAKVSVFSGLNNPDDITMDEKYVSICGYTQEELVSYFDEHIDDFARSENVSEKEIVKAIRLWYNGFSWDGKTTVYNPFSTLILFDKKRFSDYWFASATPTFLIDILRERNDVKLLLEPSQIQASGFDSFEPKKIDTKLLLFQTGYLTVKKVEKSRFGEELIYTLDIPNKEVRQSLMTHFTADYAAYPVSDTAPMRERMMEQLFDGDEKAFERSMQEMFARIPYQLHIPREAYYHSMLLVWLNLLGFEVIAELSTDKGRIDAVWTWEDRVVIAEIKFSGKGSCETLLNAALAQIKKNRYHERYAGENRRIAFLAVAFAGKKIACRMEEANL